VKLKFRPSRDDTAVKMKNVLILLLTVIFLTALSACSPCPSGANNDAPNPQHTDILDNRSISEAHIRQNSVYDTLSLEYDSDDMDYRSSSLTTTYIILKGDSISLNGDGATVEDNIVTIASAGMYSISGTLNDGQIIVNAGKEDIVKLILNNMDIACSTSAPLYIMNAKKTVVTLVEGTKNYVTDATSYILEEADSKEPDAAIFSNDDLTFNGDGSLIVEAHYNNGIQSKDDLKIISGNITVNAANNGVKGRDSVSIRDGIITVRAGNDGIQSSNADNLEKGYVYIEGGIINVTSTADGISAENILLVSGGDIAITSGGGFHGGCQSDAASNSTKGLKAGNAITIDGGAIKIDSYDDSIHSDDSAVINSGDIELLTRDDGIHADSFIEINGGEINITRCYEGIESAIIAVNGGNVHIVASDDGINIVGSDGNIQRAHRPEQENSHLATNEWLYVNGGYIFIDADGDGLDINGSVKMNGGTVIINGPITKLDGALDYYGSFKVTGGLLVAVDSSRRAHAPDASSTQHSVLLNLRSRQRSNTLIHIETEEGEAFLTFAPTKDYQSVLLSSPQMEGGTTCIIYTGGNSSGTANDGLYSGSTYTPGTEIARFTLSGMVTIVDYASYAFPNSKVDNAFPDPIPH
jgi:hypothetical protein